MLVNYWTKLFTLVLINFILFGILTNTEQNLYN